MSILSILSCFNYFTSTQYPHGAGLSTLTVRGSVPSRCCTALTSAHFQKIHLPKQKLCPLTHSSTISCPTRSHPLLHLSYKWNQVLPHGVLFGVLPQLMLVTHSCLGLNNMSSCPSTRLLVATVSLPVLVGIVTGTPVCIVFYVDYMSTMFALSKCLFKGAACNSFQYIPAEELLDHMVILCLTF